MSQWNRTQSNQGKKDVLPDERSFRILLGIACVLLIVLGFAFTDAGIAEIEDRVNYVTDSGTSPLEEHEKVTIPPQDFAVKGLKPDSNGEVRMVLWHLKDQKPDRVEVLVDGRPVQPSMELDGLPEMIRVPVPSVVTVRGLKATEEVIPYAVKFPSNDMTIFNAVAPNEQNTYTLKAVQ